MIGCKIGYRRPVVKEPEIPASQEPLKLIAEIVEHTRASQNTLPVRLRELVESGRIQRHGKAWATWYTGSSAFEECA